MKVELLDDGIKILLEPSELAIAKAQWVLFRRMMECYVYLSIQLALTMLTDKEGTEKLLAKYHEAAVESGASREAEGLVIAQELLGPDRWQRLMEKAGGEASKEGELSDDRPTG